MPTIEHRAAIDPIIQGLASRLRSIGATNEELVYAVTEVLKGVLKPSAAWTLVDATRYLSVLRHADYEAQDEVVRFELACPPNPTCCKDVKFEIKDAEKSKAFLDFEKKYITPAVKGCCKSLNCSNRGKP
jgi:hypothetical protein